MKTSRLYEYQYLFDDAGNRTQMVYYDGDTPITTTYTYNDLNQLTDRSVGGVEYDYGYDNNGNMSSLEIDYELAKIYCWNTDDRLTSMDDDEDTLVEYTYDAMGRRIMRRDVDNNTYTMYYYDGLTVIAEKKKIGAGSWDWDRIFTVGPGVIGNIFRISTKSGASWSDNYYHYDAIGNVAYVSYSDGTPKYCYDQEAYGNVKVGSQSGYHLTTKEYDSLSDLYYFWQRWYDPYTGLFISKDPISYYTHLKLFNSIKQYSHIYNFCLNNPVNYHDITGCHTVVGGLIGIIIKIIGKEAGKKLAEENGCCKSSTGKNCHMTDVSECLACCATAARVNSIMCPQGVVMRGCMDRCKKDF